MFLVVSIPLKEIAADTQMLTRLREDFVSSFNSVNMSSRSIPMTNFISLLIDLLNPSTDPYPSQQHWNEFDPLSLQLTDPEYQCRVYTDKLTLNKHRVNQSMGNPML